MEKVNVSACIIAKNEEKMLPDCLKSIKDVVQEIILVDTGSTDNTISIAEQYNCKIIKSRWNNDFSEKRNIAIDNASCPFILIIDADERLTNPEELVKTIKNAKPEIGGWLIQVTSEAARENGGADIYISTLLRLFRSHPEVRFSGIIHEQIIEPILKLGWKLEATQIHFKHLGYALSPNEMRDKQKRNLELLNKALENNPTDGHLLYQRAKTYLALGDLQKAEEDTLSALQHLKQDSAMVPQTLNFGAIIAFQMRNYPLAIARAEKSLKIVPDQAFANFILGESYSAIQNFPKALEAYINLSKSKAEVSTLASLIGDYHLPDEQLYFRLGRTYFALSKFDKALECFHKALNINPKEVGSYVGLANIAFKRKDYKEARRLLNEAIKISPQNSELYTFLTQLDKAEKQFSEEQKNIFTQKESTIKQEATSKAQPLLTLSMIVKNEEKMLPGCLESVKDVVDEIVIVDTGSEDNTIEIAKQWGAKIIQIEWKNDFSYARNIALKNSTGKWILYLDADERLKIEYPHLFRNFLENSPEEIGAYICTIESNHIQLDGSVEHHRGGYPRLFRNYGYPKIKFQGRVHEQITPSIFELKKSILLSDIVIEHLGYNQSREIMEKKVRRNYQLLMEHIKDEPLSSYAWYQLGQTLAQMALFDEAEKAIRFAISLGNMSKSIYASATATLSQIVGNQKKFEEALFWAEKSLEKAPNQVYALNLKAYSLLYLGRKSEAEQTFLEVLERLKQKKGVPQSGFDIDIPESIVLKGLEEARK